jgi:hypothetical protein
MARTPVEDLVGREFSQEIEQLIVRMAKENKAWGYQRAR